MDASKQDASKGLKSTCASEAAPLTATSTTTVRRSPNTPIEDERHVVQSLLPPKSRATRPLEAVPANS